MKKYQYSNPIDFGYTKIKFTRQQHNQLFKHRPISIFYHYDYYIGDDKLILHSTVSLFWTIVITIAFPIVLLFDGLSNFKSTLREYHKLYNQKRLGNFSADHCWSNTETYARAVKIAKDSGKWG